MAEIWKRVKDGFGIKTMEERISDLYWGTKTAMSALVKLEDANKAYRRLPELKAEHVKVKKEFDESRKMIFGPGYGPDSGLSEYEERLLDKRTNERMSLMERVVQLELMIEPLESTDYFTNRITNYLNHRSAIDAYQQDPSRIKGSRDYKKDTRLQVKMQGIDTDIMRIDNLERELFTKNLHLLTLLPPTYSKKFDRYTK